MKPLRATTTRAVAEAPFYLAQLRRAAKADHGPPIKLLEAVAKAVTAQSAAEDRVAMAVAEAKAAGWTWGQIAPLVGLTTSQGAAARYRDTRG